MYNIPAKRRFSKGEKFAVAAAHRHNAVAILNAIFRTEFKV